MHRSPGAVPSCPLMSAGQWRNTHATATHTGDGRGRIKGAFYCDFTMMERLINEYS